MQNFLAEMSYSNYQVNAIVSHNKPFIPRLIKSHPDFRYPGQKKSIHRIGNAQFWIELPESLASDFINAWNKLPAPSRSEYNFSCMCLSPNLKDRRKQEKFFNSCFGSAAIIFIELFNHLNAYFWTDFNIPSTEPYWNQYIDACLSPAL